MTVGINEDITAAQYEDLRGKAARVLGQPSGSWSTASIGTVAGYDQNPDAPIKLPADLLQPLTGTNFIVTFHVAIFI